MRTFSTLLASLAAAILLSASPASAATISDYPVNEYSTPLPGYVAPGLNGSVWLLDEAYRGARQFGPDGASLNGVVYGATTGDLAYRMSDDTLIWPTGTDTSGGYLQFSPGRYSGEPVVRNGLEPGSAVGLRSNGKPLVAARLRGTSGQFSICDLAVSNQTSCIAPRDTRYTDLSLDGAGRMWAVAPEGDTAVRLSTSGASVERTVALPAGSQGRRIALGADGAMWIAGFGNAAGAGNQIIRLPVDGQPQSFPLPAGRGPNDITLGADGALWFTEYLSHSIGRLTTAGEYSSCSLPNAASAPGPYAITTATDGAIWFSERNARRIGRLTGGPCIPPAVLPGPAAVDTVKPRLTALGLSRTAFAAAGSGASVSAKAKKRKRRKAKVGTKVSFTLSEPGAVKFTVQRKTRGRKVGRTCKARTRKNRKKKACTRYVAVRGSFTVAGKVGRNAFTFRGRVGGRKLRTGSYRLGGQATDAARNASVVARRSFKIVR